jgi:hypothetical protein
VTCAPTAAWLVTLTKFFGVAFKRSNDQDRVRTRTPAPVAAIFVVIFYVRTTIDDHCRLDSMVAHRPKSDALPWPAAFDTKF